MFSDSSLLESAQVPRLRRPLWPLLAAALLRGGLVLAGALLRRPGAPEPPVFKQVTFRRGIIAEARFAPDGQTIIYGSAVDGRHNRIFSARLGSAEVRAMDLPEGDIAGITASGEMAVILSNSFNSRVPGTLARASLAGGAPRELLEKVSMADWGPDGGNLAVIRHDGPKPRLEFPIGRVLYVSESWISCPRVSPKGYRVAFKERISGVRTDEGVALRVTIIGSGGNLATESHHLSLGGRCTKSLIYQFQETIQTI